MSKFKIGDRVRVIKEYPDTYWDIGMEGVVEYICDSPLKYHVIGDKGRFHNLAEEQLELVTEAPKRPFKVGDKVRIVKQRETTFNRSLTPKVLDSTVYTIKIYDRSELPYKCISEDRGTEYWCTDEQLELVEEKGLIPKDNPALSTSKHTFKVGDKVRVIDHTPLPSTLPVIWVSAMNEYCGKIGTIGIICQSGVINVVFDDDNDWSFDPAWLTPVTEAKCDGGSIADIFNRLFGSSSAAKKDKINIKTKLISNTKLLTNLKLN